MASASADACAIVPYNQEEKPKSGLYLLAAAVAGALKTAASRLSVAFHNAIVRGKDVDSEEVNRQVRAAVKQAKILWMVAPFAAMSSSGSNMFLLITRAVASFIKLYLLLLFLRVLLSWFPTFDWMQQPWLALRQVTDPYLNLFRGIVPPLLGTIDFTPLLGFFILQFLAGALDIGHDDDAW